MGDTTQEPMIIRAGEPSNPTGPVFETSGSNAKGLDSQRPPFLVDIAGLDISTSSCCADRAHDRNRVFLWLGSEPRFGCKSKDQDPRHVERPVLRSV